ncbi:cell division protein ZipA [Idiomarina seosinensis]|uniref:Cell division protein ZipA n=1 Tax=Idiomarina seosinensis TaxID=281739 RepID=A0A432ZIS0_9GAMM|nr:cell division protein ZipA [Idiomarina seosinensis]RUO77925.1 cell division protein ZipA [Idiomarina seosinensis]
MSNLQITLSIVGVLLIIAIVAHGLWTMRKNNQQVDQQKQRVAEQRQQSSQPESFDDDDIGEVRVVKRAAQEKTDNADAEVEQMSMNLDLDNDDNTPLPSMRVDKDDEESLQQAELELSEEKEPEPQTQQDTDSESAPAKQEKPGQPINSDKPLPPKQQVISLFVKGSVQGSVLLQMMTELGCKFGDMGIFHRYEQTSGNGPMIFSVANMFNPGTFDLDNIENFETEGVALFMALPLDYDGQQAFNMMLNAAKKLAMEIPQGQVLDGNRQLLSRQSIQQAHQTIREYEKAYT